MRERDKAFIEELRQLLNKHSMEGASNTPDFMLAQYLFACLAAFDATVEERRVWHGAEL